MFKIPKYAGNIFSWDISIFHKMFNSSSQALSSYIPLLIMVTIYLRNVLILSNKDHETSIMIKLWKSIKRQLKKAIPSIRKNLISSAYFQHVFIRDC
jgi:hypothetical protein